MCDKDKILKKEPHYLLGCSVFSCDCFPSNSNRVYRIWWPLFRLENSVRPFVIAADNCVWHKIACFYRRSVRVQSHLVVVDDIITADIFNDSFYDLVDSIISSTVAVNENLIAFFLPFVSFLFQQNLQK